MKMNYPWHFYEPLVEIKEGLMMVTLRIMIKRTTDSLVEIGILS